jgi:hypothetical protein
LLRTGSPPIKQLPSLDKLLDIIVSRLACALEALRQMHVSEGRPLPDRYSHLKPLRKAQQHQQLMLLMVNDAERYGQRGPGAGGPGPGQQRPGGGGAGSAMGPLGLVSQGGDDRSAAGLAIQHTFGGVSLTSKATKRSAIGGGKGGSKGGVAASRRGGSGTLSAASSGAAGAGGGVASSSSSRQQQADMGVSAAGRQRKRKAVYGGDGAEWFVPPLVGASKDEQQQGPAQPHVLPQHHPLHQIRRGAAGDGSGNFVQFGAAAAAAEGGGDVAGADGLAGLPLAPYQSQQQQQQQQVQQYPQQRGENSSSESDGTVYCMCLQAHDQDYFISCDRCGDWCHVKCVGMTIAAARTAKSWCCPICLAVGGDKRPLTATSERLARVRTPLFLV